MACWHPARLPVRELSCQISGYEDVGGDVVRLRLRLPAGRQPRYHAGQYLLLQREDGEWSAFSSASAPGSGRELELHVLAREESAVELLAFLRRRLRPNPDALRRHAPPSCRRVHWC